MIKIYNRQTKEYEVENVAGEKYIKWTYESPVGKGLLELFVKRKLFSKIYGSYCDTKLSKKKINPFIEEFNIDMTQCVNSESDFNNFNDFFIRQLTADARPIDMDKTSLISPGDGRLMAFTNIDINKLVQVKGLTYSLSELLEDNEIAKNYNGGTCLILRLCPTDYHRFHFIDNGTIEKSNFIKGNYYSVNPTALEKIPKLYCQNKREWSVFHTENFDDVIIVEVGASCVGTIVQTYKPNSFVHKGDEKGYFKFGGSTTILFFKPNTIVMDEDILTQSDFGFETKVSMGDKIGIKLDK